MTRQSCTLLASAICLALAFVQDSFAQSPAPITSGERSPKSRKLQLHEDRLARYQLRDDAAQAVAEGRIANGKLAVAGLIGQLQAKGDLRKAEADYAQICADTGKSKFAAEQDIAATLNKVRARNAAQVRERAEARRSAAMARVEQIRHGDWPLALRTDAYLDLRDQLSAAVHFRGDLVSTDGGVASECVQSIVAQLLTQLSERRQGTRTMEYLKAKRFLEDLKHLFNDQPISTSEL